LPDPSDIDLQTLPRKHRPTGSTPSHRLGT
jgi:hypothetical protein